MGEKRREKKARLTLFPLFFSPIIVLIFNSMMEFLDSGSLDPLIEINHNLMRLAVWTPFWYILIR